MNYLYIGTSSTTQKVLLAHVGRENIISKSENDRYNSSSTIKMYVKDSSSDFIISSPENDDWIIETHVER